jgi:hypothetical protein
VLECQGTGTDVTFALAIKKFETSLTMLDTAPPIIAAVIKHPQQRRKFGDQSLPWFNENDQWGTQHAVKEQDIISWYQFLLG